jgi:NAD(P)-dependent dehydrogenase (short-subunit alcohol dehydrogenase family)
MAEAADETNRTKIAIVTGGSRGLGRSTVLSLAKRGCGVIFTYHSNDGEARVVVNEIGKAHGKAIAIQLDTGLISSFVASWELSPRVSKRLGATNNSITWSTTPA